MVYLKKYIWIVELLVLSIFSGAFSCASGIKIVNQTATQYHEYTTSFFLQTQDISHIEPFFAFFAILPICGFMALNGTYIYSKWNINAIYLITRQKKRRESFFKDTIFLFLRAIIGGLIYLLVPLIYFTVALGKNALENQVELNLSILISAVTLCYSLAAIQNYISILTGSNYGMFGGIVIFLLLGTLGMSLINKKLIICKLFSMINPFIPFYLSATNKISLVTTCILALIHSILITVVGIILIHKVDIGLSNKEIM